MMQKVKNWEIKHDFRYFKSPYGYVIQVNFISGEQMLLDIPQAFIDSGKSIIRDSVVDEYVEIELKKAFKQERIDKLNSILHEEN